MGLVSPGEGERRQNTIQQNIDIKIIHGIKTMTMQTMKIGMKIVALGYNTLRSGVATAAELSHRSDDLKSTAQKLLNQISVGSDKSRMGWKRFVKSLKLMTKSFVILLTIEFAGDEDSNENENDNNGTDWIIDNNRFDNRIIIYTSGSGNHDRVNTLSPQIMNNKNRGDTGRGDSDDEDGLRDKSGKFYQIGRHGVGTQHQQSKLKDENSLKVIVPHQGMSSCAALASAAGDMTPLLSCQNCAVTASNRVNGKSIEIVNSTTPPPLVMSTTATTMAIKTTPMTNLLKAMTMPRAQDGSCCSNKKALVVQLFDTRQILNMKCRLPLNHRCVCCRVSCWLCSSGRSGRGSGGTTGIRGQEKCYQVKLSYVDKRIVCVNTPTLHQMKSLKLY